MTILDNLKSFTVSQYIIAGLAITYLVLTIIALAAVYGESPNVELARKVFTGLLTMSAFGAGYVFRTYMYKTQEVGMVNIVSGVGALVFAVLAIGASNAINSVEKDAIDSTKKWLMGMGVMSLIAITTALFQHGPTLSAMASKYYGTEAT